MYEALAMNICLGGDVTLLNITYVFVGFRL